MIACVTHLIYEKLKISFEIIYGVTTGLFLLLPEMKSH